MPDRIRVGVDVVALSLAHHGAASEDGSGGWTGEEGDVPVLEAYVWRGEDAEHRLPGVSLQPSEDLEDAARRVLGTIGITQPGHLEQLASFGAPGRVPGVRTMSVSYLALLPRPTPPAQDGHDGAWHPVAALDVTEGFVWDHGQILTAGLQRVRSKLSYSTIAVGLLPDTFTMSELQAVYEAVLGTVLDKRNFRRRIMGLGVLEDTGGMRRGPHRPARLYTFVSSDLVVLDDVVLRT